MTGPLTKYDSDTEILNGVTEHVMRIDGLMKALRYRMERAYMTDDLTPVADTTLQIFGELAEVLEGVKLWDAR